MSPGICERRRSRIHASIPEFTIINSVAKTMPDPSLRGRRYWHTTPNSDHASWAETNCWLSFGKASIMRPMADGASFVCMVAITRCPVSAAVIGHWAHYRSEEHTSELQSRSDLVCRLLLEK